ncbi:MAG: hypothetical protein LBS49_02860, partial [Candidatus Accumulibacter sp.]|nr:hypothetical protein [Accumulibacter sp.]
MPASVFFAAFSMLRTVSFFAVFHFAPIALAFIAACYFKHPLFYFWRGVELPILLLAGSGGACLAFRALRGA